MPLALPLRCDGALAISARIGLLGIEPHTRRRNRANGVVDPGAAGRLRLQVKESFGNCPQHITVRTVRSVLRQPGPVQAFAGLASAARALVARWLPLAVLPDNITTDHLSPSNAILPSSAAGEYLAKMGLPEEDFNSYATHRGDHLTAQRATFANPKLINEMAVENGQVKQGSLARIEPEGKVTRMWEAIETYMERKQPLIIIAGADYGQGSSREIGRAHV